MENAIEWAMVAAVQIAVGTEASVNLRFTNTIFNKLLKSYTNSVKSRSCHLKQNDDSV